MGRLVQEMTAAGRLVQEKTAAGRLVQEKTSAGRLVQGTPDVAVPRKASAAAETDIGKATVRAISAAVADVRKCWRLSSRN